MTDTPITYRPDRTPLLPPGGAELHARDMSATFSADVTLAEAQARLAELGQWLPVDGDPSWTMGRLVGVNSTGPLRLGYGAWRDLLLGCQFLNGRGELISAGGRTVKNVAGYDLTKFMVGQAGIFGRLVTVTTRTYRRPVGAILARFPADVAWVNRLLPTPCRPQWMALTRDVAWCGYLGDERTLAYYRGALPGHGPTEVIERSVDADVGHRGELWHAAGVEGSFRAAVPPTKVLEFAAAAGLADWSADAAFGIVIGLAEADRRHAIESAARAVGGNVYFIENGRTIVRMDEGQRALMRRLKAAFDPDGTLEPLPEPT
jgi:FAD/FMN-containing dehydrogenase